MDVGGVPTLALGKVNFELVPGKGVRASQNLLGFTNGLKAGRDGPVLPEPHPKPRISQRR